jgi:hypothetical protein
MAAETQYDVFLSHNSVDREAVEVIARGLREEARLEPFLDRWHLVPGEPWQEALWGQGKTLGDGYVRVFDVFRHVASHVPTRADQHPIFKATAMEEDFPIALAGR